MIHLIILDLAISTFSCIYLGYDEKVIILIKLLVEVQEPSRVEDVSS